MASKWNDSLIVVDTREQEPYWPLATRVTLATGDYSVAGYENSIAVERKSAADLFGSLGGKSGARRERLLRAIRRLSMMPWGAMVVESTPSGLFAARRYGRITPAHALGAVLRWSGRYRVPVYFCEGRVSAKSLVKTYLRLAWEESNAMKHDTPTCPCGGGAVVPHAPSCG